MVVSLVTSLAAPLDALSLIDVGFFLATSLDALSLIDVVVSFVISTRSLIEDLGFFFITSARSLMVLIGFSFFDLPFIFLKKPPTPSLNLAVTLPKAAAM